MKWIESSKTSANDLRKEKTNKDYYLANRKSFQLHRQVGGCRAEGSLSSQPSILAAARHLI
jgi:hypothetical protein